MWLSVLNLVIFLPSHELFGNQGPFVPNSIMEFKKFFLVFRIELFSNNRAVKMIRISKTDKLSFTFLCIAFHFFLEGYIKILIFLIFSSIFWLGGHLSSILKLCLLLQSMIFFLTFDNFVFIYYKILFTDCN